MGAIRDSQASNFTMALKELDASFLSGMRGFSSQAGIELAVDYR